MIRLQAPPLTALSRFLLILTFSFSGQVFAQKPAAFRELPFEILTIEDGLSQGMVNCIAQDHFGFLWFGTKDGLNRYDGLRFVVYRNIANDTTSLSDNYVQTVFEDSRHRMWIGTSQEGIQLFDRETETFRRIQLQTRSKENPSGTNVVKIGEDRFGNIWAGTRSGLFKLSFDTSASGTDLYHQPINIKKYFNKPCNFTVSQSGQIWGSSGAVPAFRITPAASGQDAIDTLDLKESFFNPNQEGNAMRYFAVPVEDTLRNRIYMLYEYCFVEINPANLHHRQIFRRDASSGAFVVNAVTDVQGSLWVTSTGNAEQFDFSSGTIRKIGASDDHFKSIAESIRSVFICKSGIVWLGSTGYGLLKYNPNKERFHLKKSISMGWMCPDADGRILTAMPMIFLAAFDARSADFPVYLTDSLFRQLTGLPVAGRTISVLQDRQKNYWFCKDYLVRYHPDEKKPEIIGPKGTYGVPLLMDGDTGLYFGTDRGFTYYHIQKKQFIYHPYPFEVNQAPYFFLQALYRDAQGNFWMGTTAGILFLDAKKSRWKWYSNDQKNPASLSNNVVFSLLPDPVAPEKYLWIGTNGGGLNRMDLSNGTFISFTQKNGLPNDVVYGILSDRSGHLWLSTNRGISRFHIKDQSFRNFDVRDGLQGNEFNRNAFCKDAAGQLYFGGINGFNYFDPDRITDNAVAPTVVITGIKLKNQYLAFQESGAVIQHPPYLASDMTLHYRDNMITFEFAALEFTAPFKNRYKYKMEGFDHEWIESGNTPSAIYTNLDPGSYRFLVMGSNNDGVWGNTPAQIHLTILPPWYMTWWFRLLAVGMVGISVYWLYRYRLRQAIKLQQLRNRIASDLHDEIGSTLSSIALYGEATKKVLKDNPDAFRMVSRINDNTNSMMEAMSDIVWSINAKGDLFEEVISKMHAFAAEVTGNADCELHFSEDPGLSRLHLDMIQRKNIYLIFKEAVNNAVKYSGCRNLYVELRSARPGIYMMIRDDGKGFDPATVRRGNGLNNMEQRAIDIRGTLTIESAPGTGTTLTLQARL